VVVPPLFNVMVPNPVREVLAPERDNSTVLSVISGLFTSGVSRTITH